MKQLLTIFFFFSALFSGFCASGGSIQKLEKRLNLYPSNLKLRYVLSRAYASQGKDNPRYFDKSIQQLEEIIRVKQIPVVKFYLGLVFARKGNLDRAIYHWLTVVRSLKPNNLTTLRYLALAFEKKGKHSDSLKYWNKILSINPEDYKAHYHTALVTLKNLSVDESLRYSTAIRHFNKVISKYPSHPKSLYYLQATYRSSRQYLKQRKVLNRLLVMNPKNDKIRREFQLNKENLKRQPQDQVLKRPEPIPVKVVTEITDEDFQAAFKSDPEAHEVPEDHEPEAVHKNPTLPLDSPLSADAEILFNQGVTYLQNKEYDLALFNFLQAQELDPKFAQCYLQIGEVYLKLSDSTPTEEKFSEHLRLSRQSLTTAVELEPDSLLAHASRAKLKLVDQKEKEGFEVAHMKVARDAIQNGNTLFAIEEFIILITNNFVPMELVFALRDLINDVDEGTRLDLNNVLQPLIADGSPQGLYLGACLRIQRDFGEGLHLIDQIFDSKQSPTEFFRDLKARADRGNADFLDHYLLGRYLLKKEAFGAAKKHLEEAIKLAPDDAQKKKLEFYRDKAGSAGPSKIFTPIAIHGDKKPPFERFDREKADLISAEPSFSSVFKADASMGLLGAKKEFLERFLLEKSKNAVGNFLLGLIYQQSSLESTLQKAEELKIEAVESYPSDSGWHLSMGILSLRLGDSSYTQKFFQQSRAILLRKGWESYEPYAKVIGSEAAVQIGLSKLGRARELIRSGFQFNPHSRQVAHSQAGLMSASHGAGTVSPDREFFSRLMEQEIFSEVYKAEIGLLIFWSLFTMLLFFSSVIVYRKREELKHFTDELFGEKSLSIPVMVFLGGILLILFPTGLVVFLPILLWTFLDDFEQIAFILGILALLAVPFLFPIGYRHNLKDLKALYQLREGQTTEPKAHYTERLNANPLDTEARFQLGLLELIEGQGPAKAVTYFEQILSEKPDHFFALANLGVSQARLGNLDRAIQYLSKALNINPIDDKVLYNLSRVYELKGDLKLASNYLKWIGGSGEISKKIIDRYLRLGSSADPLFAPLYLTGAVRDYNSYFSGGSSGGFGGGTLLFLIWFFVGGGGVAILLFLKDKMQIQITLCRFCERRICGNCQSLLSGESLCSECFESSQRRSKGLLHYRKEREKYSWGQARKLSFVLPGFASVYRGQLMLGLLISFFFWSFLFLGFFHLDFLWNQFLPFQNSFTFLIQTIALGISLLVYLLGQGLAFMSQGPENLG